MTEENGNEEKYDYKAEQKRRKLERKRLRDEHEKQNPEERIDYWKIESFKPGDMPEPLIQESSFSVLFPTYREKYLREIWTLVTKHLSNYGIKCVLDCHQGSINVMTSRRTWDPWAILSARDFIKLLARSVPYEQALRVFEDGTASEIIKIGNLTRNKQKFVKRRQRLIGPNGQTLKAIELLTKCYVLVMGSTVSVIGPLDGIIQVRRIAQDCMKNIHPVYHIKELMIKKELSKNPELAHESWDRFLPRFKSKNQKKKKLIPKKKKKYSPFPPPQTPRKIDLQIESGEYFLSKEQQSYNQRKEKQIKQAEKTKERELEREKAFIPPVEENTNPTFEKDINTSVQNIKNLTKKRKSEKQTEQESDYILAKKTKNN